MTRTTAVLLLLLASAAGGPGDAYEDMEHPRAPGTPLEVVFTPYRCTECAEDDPEHAGEIKMMRVPVEEIAKICEVGRGRWVAIESPHFKLFSSLRGDRLKMKDARYARADMERLKTILPKTRIGGRVSMLDPHERAHLYIIRAERIYAHLKALTNNDKRYLGILAKYQMYLFEDYGEHHILCDRFTGRTNDKAGVEHHIRDKPNFMMFSTYADVIPGDDNGLASHVVHHVAHNLIDGYGNYLRETWAWLEEGIAHYYERKEQVDARRNTFCWSEGKAPTMFQKPNWEKTILNLVRRGKDTPLSQWCEKLQPGELTAVENGLSWSIVKWLVETEPIRFGKLVDKLQDYKGKPTAAQSIEHAFGVNPALLHERWREYVVENYGKR